MKLVRTLLIASGVIVTLFGGWELLTQNRPASLLGLGFWLVGALVLHDGVLAGIIVLTNRFLRAFLSGIALTAAQVGLGVIATFALIWIPVVLANGKVTQISALPLNYEINLVAVLAVSGLITVGLVAFFTVRKKGEVVSDESTSEILPEVHPIEEAPEDVELYVEEAQANNKARWALPVAATLLVAGSATLVIVLSKRRSG